jgi:hypothetical protein
MIISHGRKFIFVHIPKTGGTSLALALEGRAMKDDILIGDTPKAKQRKGRLKALTPAGRLWKHATLTDIEGVVDPEDFFVVTLVRNPWDRVVSYYHWLQDQTFSHPAVGLAQTLEFSAFLNHPVVTRSLFANPYASYVTDARGIERCQLFVRLEHLASDLAPLWTHLGFECQIGRENASRRQADFRTYYTDEDARHIQNVCGEDVKRFGYSYDG